MAPAGLLCAFITAESVHMCVCQVKALVEQCNSTDGDSPDQAPVGMEVTREVWWGVHVAEGSFVYMWALVRARYRIVHFFIAAYLTRDPLV